MLFEHQVLHSLHDKLGAGIHHSGKQAAEEGKGREKGDIGREEEGKQNETERGGQG